MKNNKKKVNSINTIRKRLDNIDSWIQVDDSGISQIHNPDSCNDNDYDYEGEGMLTEPIHNDVEFVTTKSIEEIESWYVDNLSEFDQEQAEMIDYLIQVIKYKYKRKQKISFKLIKDRKLIHQGTHVKIQLHVDQYLRTDYDSNSDKKDFHCTINNVIQIRNNVIRECGHLKILSNNKHDWISINNWIEVEIPSGKDLINNTTGWILSSACEFYVIDCE